MKTTYSRRAAVKHPSESRVRKQLNSSDRIRAFITTKKITTKANMVTKLGRGDALKVGNSTLGAPPHPSLVTLFGHVMVPHLLQV
ncbi:hypothetical protein TNCV_3936791 [Trichonephila clavipes]|nr:hypothetical protein TNCV_3936791 [Trichonephila clavipes]